MTSIKTLTTATILVASMALCHVAQAKSGSGSASWYGPGFHGKRTASGEIYNQNAMTAASNIHKMGTKLRVTNIKTGKSVVVRVNDTGGFGKYNRALDLSRAAFAAIAPLGQGVVKVKYEVLK